VAIGDLIEALSLPSAFGPAVVTGQTLRFNKGFQQGETGPGCGPASDQVGRFGWCPVTVSRHS